MKYAPNGCVVFLPRGRNPREDLSMLADCIAGSNADIFDDQGCLIWIDGGKRVPVTPEVLREICRQHVVTKHPQESEDGWDIEYRPYELDEITLRTLITARTWEDGGLIWRLPRTPPTLSDRQRQEVRERLAR